MSIDTIPCVQDRIVVEVDGSEPSKHALLCAQFLAHATGASIEAVSTWEPFSGWAGTGWAAMPADWNPAGEAEQALATTIQEVFGEQHPPGLTAEVREGNPAKVLLDASDGARMLVVGSRGHGGLDGLLPGPVSAACAEHAICPAFVRHGTTPSPSRTGSPS